MVNIIRFDELDHFYPKIGSEFFLKNHAIAPFYYPFIKNVDSNHSNQLESDYFKRKNSRNKLYIPDKHQLYFCKEYLKEQLKHNGEGYWDRLHQIPLILCVVYIKYL